MTKILVLLLALAPLRAEHILYVCAANTATYVVGSKLPASGVFRRAGAGDWQHIGFNHPFTSALAYDAADPSTLYLAAGNGLIRLGDGGAKWTILTGNDVTELRDVALDLHVPGSIYFAHTHGVARSYDAGKTWQDASGDLPRRYVEALRVDRGRAGVLLAGTESGVFRSENQGAHWRVAGAAGLQVLRLEQSPADACVWLASTQGGGLFASADCGRTFENTGGQTGVNRNIMEIAWDPHHRGRVAAAGWAFGVAISEDNGRTWVFKNAGLPGLDVWSFAFDPDRADRVYASVSGEGMLVSDDGGKSWKPDGLSGKAATRLLFISAGPRGAR